MEALQHMQSLRKIVYVMLALMSSCLPTQVFAQAVGSFVGTVTDSTGAVIVQAKVVATRRDTGISQSTVTSDAGTFAIPHLSVGTYTVQVEAPGFATKSISGVMLDVSQQRELDFKLSPSGTTVTAEVSASVETMNTTNGSIGGVVSEQQIQTLPLNGRSIQNLVMLQPGMAPDSGSMGWLAPQWISNGNRAETTEATLDGSDATDAEMGTVQFWNFNLDAIAEFRVLQANYSAEFGQGGGSIIQIVSKSGTNKFHGSAFEFIRNSAFDAANYFSSNGVSPFQRNEFGATLGGPVIHNKTFFFVEYAGLQQRLGEPTIMNVPTSDERSGIVQINGYQYQVPLNSVAQQVLGKYPLPNQPNGIYGANTFNKLFKQPTTVNQYSVRVDHKISASDSLFGRASYINNELKDANAVAAIEGPSFASEVINNPRNFALGETHIFSQNLVNNLTFSVNRQVEGATGATQQYTQTTIADGSLSNWGPDTFVSKYVETYYIASNKLSWNWGRQLLTIGAEYRYGQDDGYGAASVGPNGQYTFNSGTPLTQDIPSTDGGPTITAGTGSPSGLVSLMEGAAVNYRRSTAMPGYGPAGGGLGEFGLRVWHIAPFIQDDIKFTPKLTVNLGLRYEYNSVPFDIQSRLGGIADSGPLFGNLVLNPRPLYQPDYLSFAPRFGIAYRASNKSILRGGLAIFSNMIPTVYPDQAGVDFPLNSFSALNNPPYSLTPLAVTLPALTSTSGAVMPPNGDTKKIPANTPVNLAPIAALNGPILGYWPSDKLKNGYTLTGNFTFEQQLPGDLALQMSYVTNHGFDLYQSSYPNSYYGAQVSNTPYTNISPGLGEIILFYNNAVSHYNALQAQARKISPSHGITYQVNYTWGKDLTDADAVWSAPGASGGISLNNPTCIRCEYARASYNVAQRLVGNFTYQIPRFSRAVPKVLSDGWQALGIFNLQSGFPFTIVGPYGTLQYGFDELNGVGARPFFIKQAGRDPQHRAQFFSNDAINSPANYWNVPTVTSNISGVGTVQTAPGSLGRNTYTGPSWWNLDFSMDKETHLADALNMEFRAEFFNIFNHPTFGTPGGTLTSSGFGLISNTHSAERQMQFGLRFKF
jgi:hypothetical protein